MGHYYYSSTKATGLTPERVQGDLEALNAELWPDGRYRVEREQGVPAGSEDDRLAQWYFDFTRPPIPGCDAAFSLALLRDGRFEFKVPRTSWDQYWEDQQRVRRRLVRRYNRAS